jgi:hypothetical protein
MFKNIHMIISNIDEYKKFSHKNVEVQCDSNCSENCFKTWTCKLSEISVKRDRNKSDKDYCLPCSVILKRSADSSHFFKYKKDNEFFNIIDSNDKAYTLGWIASDGHIRRKRFTIKIADKDSYVLEYFSKLFSNGKIPIHHKTYDEKVWGILDVSSMKMTKCLIKHLKIDFGPKDFTVSFPSLADDKLTWAFIRGLFEGDGSIYISKFKRPRIVIASVSDNMKLPLMNFLKQFGIKSLFNKKKISINGRYAAIMIEKMYDNEYFSLLRKKNICMEYIDWKPKTKKLDYETAQEIRRIFNGKELSVIGLGKKYNVGSNAIYSILNENSYKEGSINE